MAMKYTHDIVVSGEKYTDKNGQQKTSYQNIGKVFTDEQGHMSMKITAIPVGNWEGWANLYPKKEG